MLLSGGFALLVSRQSPFYPILSKRVLPVVKTPTDTIGHFNLCNEITAPSKKEQIGTLNATMKPVYLVHIYES